MSKHINQGGVKMTSYASEKQILVAPEQAFSVGVVVSNEGVTATGTRKIIKAGTPLVGNLDQRTTPFKVADDSTAKDAVCVALHDIDVTDGNMNATALVAGIINKNMLEPAVKTLVEAGAKLNHIIAIAM